MEDDLYNTYREKGTSHPIPSIAGGFFSTLLRLSLPLLREMGGRAIRVAARTAHDVLGKRYKLGDALLKHTVTELDRSRSPSPSNSVLPKQQLKHAQTVSKMDRSRSPSPTDINKRKRHRALDIFQQRMKRARL